MAVCMCCTAGAIYSMNASHLSLSHTHTHMYILKPSHTQMVNMGVMATITQSIDAETAVKVNERTNEQITDCYDVLGAAPPLLCVDL
jgi:hypothetical protein